MTDPHTRIVRSRAALNAARLADALDAVINALEQDAVVEVTLTQLRRMRDTARGKEKAA